jgi:hypothetical protein
LVTGVLLTTDKGKSRVRQASKLGYTAPFSGGRGEEEDGVSGHAARGMATDTIFFHFPSAGNRCQIIFGRKMI